MTVDVKICGLRDAASVDAAVEGGARFLGFVFYPKSPRAVDALAVANVIAVIPTKSIPVGLFVNPTDDEILNVLKIASLRMIQLHGQETPQRVAAIKTMTGLPVIKAIGVAAMEDINVARQYESVADYLLFDAKPAVGGLPGGNAIAFDWALLKGLRFSVPWMLAGGLNIDNIASAVAASGAKIIDVSSGVEDGPGMKNPAKIKAFLQVATKLETCC